MIMLRLIAWLCVVSWVRAELRLLQVTEYCRHGARTAKEYFPSGDNLEESKLGNSKLIPSGFHQHYELGKALKQKYSTFLANLTPQQVEISSSQSDRTMESAWSQLIGLLGSGAGPRITGTSPSSEIWLPAFSQISPSLASEDLTALPNRSVVLALNVQEERTDHIFQPSEGKAVCPKASAQFSADRKVAYKEYINHPGVAAVRDLLNKKNFIVSKVFEGAEKWDVATIGAFFSEINGKRYFYGGDGQDGQDKLTSDEIDKIEQIQALKFALMYRNETITRFRADKFMREVIQGFDRLKSNASDPLNKKFRLFSGHDTGLYAVMQRLNLTNLSCTLEAIDKGSAPAGCELAPPYASNLILEFLADDAAGKYWVRGMFNSKPIKMCGSEQGYCEFEMFKVLMEQTLLLKPSEYKNLCGSTLEQTKDSWNKANSKSQTNPASPETQRSHLDLYILLCTMILLFVLVIARIFHLRADIKRRQSLAKHAAARPAGKLGSITNKKNHSGEYSERDTAMISSTEQR